MKKLFSNFIFATGVFIVNFEYMSELVLVIVLLTLNMKLSAWCQIFTCSKSILEQKKCEICFKLTIKTKQ